MYSEAMKIIRVLGHKPKKLEDALKISGVTEHLFWEISQSRELKVFFEVQETTQMDIDGNNLGKFPFISVTPEGHIAYEKYMKKDKAEKELRRDRWITRGFAFAAIIISIIALYISWLALTKTV